MKRVYVEVTEKLITDHPGRQCGGGPGPHVIEDGPIHEFQILPEHKGILLHLLKWAEDQRLKGGVPCSR